MTQSRWLFGSSCLTILADRTMTGVVVIRLASMTAFGRIGEPEDIAGVVLFLASDAASWIAGQNIGVNGGSA